MIFNYNTIEIEVLEKIKVGTLKVWKIYAKYLLAGIEVSEILWVMPKIFTDYRVIIANEMKGFFKLPKWDICFAKYRSRLYYLIRSFDPSIQPEITLRTYSKGGENDTEILYEKAQIIFAFRRLMCMSNNEDSNILVRKLGSEIRLYSLDSFTERTKPKIPDITFKKWFDLRDRVKKISKEKGEELCEDFVPASKSTLTEATEKLIGVKRPKSLENEEYERFHNEIEPLLERITSTVNAINKDYCWFISDVYNYILLSNTP